MEKIDINIYKEPEKLLKKLISFDTSNPPGYEKDCCLYIKELLDRAGIENRIYSLDENRPNLWATVKAKEPKKKPVLLYGHIDVVPSEAADWKHGPFSGIIDDGFIYGRGAVDMKSGIAIFVCFMMKIVLESINLDFDLNLLVLSDEEGTGEYGSRFIVETRPELLEGIGLALGEMGGYSFNMNGKRFYPIIVAEKQIATIKMIFRGKSGHGSLRHYNTAMEKAAKTVSTLCSNRLKTRIVPEISFMLKEFSKGMGGFKGFLMKLLLKPTLTNIVLDILKEDGILFDNLLRNSVNVTIIKGGTAYNVVPGRVEAYADIRILPGCTIEDALEDIKAILQKKVGITPKDYEIELVEYDKNDFTPNLEYYDLITETLLEMDAEGCPVPFVLGAVTDGRILSKAGVMTYGCIPMRLPKGFDFMAQAHSANEHLPVEALYFGIEAIMLFAKKYGGA